MKSLSIVVAVSAALLIMSGCANADHDNTRDLEASGEVSTLSSSAAEEPQKDSARKFIRTSDIKFRVKDVAQATYQIEDITRSFRGFVTYTHLETNTEETTTTKLSRDSSLETVHYTVVNNMTLRVPNVKLDSTLKAIASLVDFLEYRTIKADDVALQIKSNQKTQLRATGNGQRVRSAIDTRGRKLPETTTAESLATDRQKEADEAEIDNLSLLDQVNYSTVSLSLYQRTQARESIIANDNPDKYRPALGLRIWDSIRTGWHFVEDVFVALTQLWLLILLGLTGYFLYRKYRRRKQPARA